MWRYLKAAFNARPLGMFIPPNWVAVAAVALLALGFRDSASLAGGILAIGGGLELAYLFLLSTNRRFQRLVDAEGASAERAEWSTRLRSMLSELDAADQRRYTALETRCRRILGQQSGRPDTGELSLQGQGLGRLLWIYLRLLATRHALVRVLREADSVDEPVDRRLARLQKQVRNGSISADLRRSFEGQMEILRQRLSKQAEARQKLDFLEAELMRIEQQVELIREQAVVSSDPHLLSRRIDEVGATLGSTSEWIRDQQQLYGSVQDLLDEPPPLPIPAAADRAALRE